jgi:hypothetical protein
VVVVVVVVVVVLLLMALVLQRQAFAWSCAIGMRPTCLCAKVVWM